MRTGVLVGVMIFGAGCVTQRSLNLGQTAAAVGKGAADISVFTGVMYQSQTHPPTTGTDSTGDPTSTQVTSTGLSVPWFEANVNYGVSDQLGLNVHMSPAGIQPGLKITLNKSRIASIALLPQIGIGYWSYGTSTVVSGANGVGTAVNPTFTSSLIFTAGLKLLISHRAGFYFGAGYDVLINRTLEQLFPAATMIVVTTTNFSIQHQIAAAVGMSIKVGFLSIRPEIAFAIVPAISGTRTTGSPGSAGTASYSAGGGAAWAILPGFGFALTSPTDKSDKGAEEDEKNVGESEEREENEDPPPREREDDN